MKKIIGMLILLICFANADTKLYYSGYNDSSTYIQTVGMNSAWRDNIDEISFNAEKHETPSSVQYCAGLNVDLNYQGHVSPFIFLTYKNNPSLQSEYFRQGIGIAVIPEFADNLLKFPYRHKISLAIINETNRDSTVASWRYKLKANIHKVNINVVYFYLGYSDTLSLDLGVNVAKNVTLKYKYEYERVDSNTDSRSSTGLEIKL